MLKNNNPKQFLESMRHSGEHILTYVMIKTFGTTRIKMAMGPAIEDGFYFDFDKDEAIQISQLDFPKWEKEVKKIIKANWTFKKFEMSLEAAKKFFIHNEYKLELLEEKCKYGEKVIFYSLAPKDKNENLKIEEVAVSTFEKMWEKGYFIDFCKGPHVEKTGEIGAFKLLRVASAYWGGDEKNKQLTRIYGTTFATEKELSEYLNLIEEAKKRDHRKIGRELDLFHIDEKVGLGLPLWHPKGAILWRVIEDFWYQAHLRNGYQLVKTPHIGNRSLWETSGHWNFYNASMYPPIEVGQTLEEQQKKNKVKESEQYLLKPMNCPFHMQIYKNKPHSYREFPFRWAECGTVYRFEKKGELSGLTRVRGFTQDDAHIICRQDQVEAELKRVVDFILFIYQSFGFSLEQVNVYLSLRDPDNKDKYAGGDEGWEFTEEVLRKIAKEKKLKFKEEKGEAAFYGPKLDFKVCDALGREWQCSTLQFDFNLPARFDLSFINQAGEEEKPYVLHRALFGSFERFIGLLLEHYAGRLPLWLSPVQVKILPIADRHNDYSEKIKAQLEERGMRVEVDWRSERLPAKIRDAQMEQIPLMLVVGDEEVEKEMISVRKRDGKKLEQKSVVDFIKYSEEIINAKQ